MRELHCMITPRKILGIGAVLSQKGKTIEYASRISNAVERNYSITER